MKFLQKMKENKANNKGFSLVELIIVIAIMAILVGIVGTQVIPYLNKSKESKDVQIVNSYSTAAMTAYSSNADKISASTNITFKVYASGLTGDAATLAAEIQNLTYTALPTTKFTSDEGKKIADIEVTYNFTNKTITAQPVDSTGAAVLEPVVSDM